MTLEFFHEERPKLIIHVWGYSHPAKQDAYDWLDLEVRLLPDKDLRSDPIKFSMERESFASFSRQLEALVSGEAAVALLKSTTSEFEIAVKQEDLGHYQANGLIIDEGRLVKYPVSFDMGGEGLSQARAQLENLLRKFPPRQPDP